MNNMRQHYFESRANMPAKIRSALAALAIAVPALGAALPVQASNITATGGNGIYAGNAVTINGGTVTANGIRYGINVPATGSAEETPTVYLLPQAGKKAFFRVRAD